MYFFSECLFEFLSVQFALELVVLSVACRLAVVLHSKWASSSIADHFFLLSPVISSPAVYARIKILEFNFLSIISYYFWIALAFH